MKRSSNFGVKKPIARRTQVVQVRINMNDMRGTEKPNIGGPDSAFWPYFVFVTSNGMRRKGGEYMTRVGGLYKHYPTLHTTSDCSRLPAGSAVRVLSLDIQGVCNFCTFCGNKV